jgi:alkylation response protein AidB-like acyl-CoA dehydrogenase
MPYRAPVSDILFAMQHAAGLPQVIEAHNGDHGGELDADFVASILEEAGKFANDRIAPLNRVGDQNGAKLDAEGVKTAPGWGETYRDWAAGGWNGVAADPDFGGMGLPIMVRSAVEEMWSSANMAFSLCPLLTAGAVEAVAAHASDALKQTFLHKMVSGEWTGTMNLTEPQAGSDLNAIRSRAERAGDGTYRIFGQKIFITYGDHDMTDNIVHLVLARLPDAPPGTRGISLFLVPKFLVNADGSLGARNDARVHSIEHKMGIHASPTCTMVFGDHDGAVGYLIGQENRGLACMFTMMNNARLGVALQGVSVAEAAYQHALAYANDRKQGRAPGETGEGMSPIAKHADVRRMLATMKGLTQGARAICYLVAASIDLAHTAKDEAAKKAMSERASLLTPVAKAFATDIGSQVAALGVQVHGGMGFIEETGAAQYMRDAKIAEIYEGTNGIQAIDLVQRKLPLSGGDCVRAEIADMRNTLGLLRASNEPAFGHTAKRLTDAVDSLDRATQFLLRPGLGQDVLQSAATSYLRLFGLARGGVSLAGAALSAKADPSRPERIALARFFAENLAVASSGLEIMATEGSDSLASPDLLTA